ncbi:hypothetical protein [Streptomyces meridianus]|uniref:Tryptophan synthase n=1 Tax=Streptomyces meridianus TaxID=2938945 RepID=A0ABT0XAZ4_9ACTN|nr:hypothetical protein [Streptomyces meridianus]MCM2579683.1 hypothetical protein [Streptomyces meridianus]
MFVPAGLNAPAEERRNLKHLAEAGADLFEVGLAYSFSERRADRIAGDLR